MIFLISEKKWKKSAKKFVEPKDYILFDATDDETGNLTKYANVISLGGMNPPSKLLKAKEKDGQEVIDKDKVKKMENKFFKGKEFKVSAMALIKALVQHSGDVNLFVVVKNKAYKHYAKKIKKNIEKVFDIEEGDYEVIYFYEDIEENKKILKAEVKGKFINKLSNKLKDLEKKLEKE
jgi:hypothetical protein